MTKNVACSGEEEGKVTSAENHHCAQERKVREGTTQSGADALRMQAEEGL